MVKPGHSLGSRDHLPDLLGEETSGGGCTWSYKHHDTVIQGWVRGLGIKFPEPQIGAWRLTCATSRYERQAALYSGLKYRISMLSRYWRWGKKDK